ncbi:hypothetical protein HDV05_005491, partial [Chytridiales sp. JEL 0842]
MMMMRSASLRSPFGAVGIVTILARGVSSSSARSKAPESAAPGCIRIHQLTETTITTLAKTDTWTSTTTPIDSTPTHVPNTPIAHKLTQLLTTTLLPKSHTTTTHPSYIPYTLSTFLLTTFGSCTSTLSTQSLLCALNLFSTSPSSTLPLAATLTWVLKDGLGLLGGILFASQTSTRFDSNPKTHRVVSTTAIHVSTVLELCTP